MDSESIPRLHGSLRWRKTSGAVKAAFLLASAALLSFAAHVSAAEPKAPPRGAWTVTVENDALTGSDNNYTNGIGLSWVSAEVGRYERDSLVRGWSDLLSFLPFVGNDGYRTYMAWSIAQEMHTPDDITAANPPRDDQPYAGVLYVDTVVYARSERWTHAWQARVGIVGPASQADQGQKSFHKLIGGERPMGWNTQLRDEPVLNVDYTGAHLLAQGELGQGSSWRIVPVVNVGLGSYFTGVGLGLYGEVGRNLAPALGGTALRNGFSVASTVGVEPRGEWSVSVSGGLAGYGVVRYLPLDGTLFRDSRSVDREGHIAMATVGLTVRHGALVFFLGTTRLTKAFATERERSAFGTMSLSWYQ
jgi:hypothetical protein